MRSIRRLYFYLVALISLEVVVWGLINLLRTMFSEQVLFPTADTMAQALALILVGVPIFALHWLWAQRTAARDNEEQAATLRALFLYAALLATFMPIVFNLLALIDRLMIASAGLEASRAMLGYNQTLKDNLIAIVLNGVVAAYFFVVLRADWGTLRDKVNFAGVRRLYRYIWVVFGLLMTIFGVQQILSFLLYVPSAIIGETGKEVLINGLALVIVGVVIWAGMWSVCQAALKDAAEQGSMLRLAVLYLLALAAVISVLTSVGLVVDLLLRLAFGEVLDLHDFLAQINNPVSIGVPLGAVWAYYGFWLSKEINAVTEAPRRAGMRRVYYYILALIGLAATFIGLSLLLTFVIDTLVGSAALWGDSLRPRLAGAIATLLAGLPLWLLTWRPMQAEALGTGTDQDHARRSLLRKAYLYLVIFASVIGGMVSGVILVYQLLNALLSQTVPDYFLSTVLDILQALLLFVAFLIYHLVTMRRDGGQAADALATRHGKFPVVVFEKDNSGFGARVQALIAKTAPAIPVAIQPIEQGIPAEAINARAVVLPSTLAMNPPEALRLWMKEFTGQKIVVPLEEEGWLFWAAGSRTQLIRQLADGQEISPATATAPWQVVAYVFAALFLLQLTFGILAFGISLVVR